MRRLAFRAWSCNYGGMLLSGYPKKVQLLGGVVGPSIGCGIFLGLALMYLSESRIFSLVLMLVLAGLTLFVAIESCKKIAKLIS